MLLLKCQKFLLSRVNIVGWITTCVENLGLLASAGLLGDWQTEIYLPEGSRHAPSAVRRKPRHTECPCYYWLNVSTIWLASSGSSAAFALPQLTIVGVQDRMFMQN